MAVTGKSKLKLLCLIDIFTRKTDSSHVLTSAEICGELSKMGIAAERKSVYRDIDSLKEYGYDINRVRAPKSGFYLGKRSIDTAEAQLIADVMANVDFLSAGRKREVIEKILSPLSEYQSAAITAGISDKASNEPFADTFSVLSSIHTAIERKRKITLKYARRSVDGKSLSAEMKEFTLSPYALIWSGEHYYLVANNGKYDNLMHLRADRIVQAALTGEKARNVSEVSEYRDKFDALDYREKVFNMFSGSVMEIQLVCDNSIIEDVSDRFGASAEYKPYDTGTFLLKGKAGVSEGLVSWLFQFGAKVKVKAPQTLKDMYLKRLAEINKAAGLT